MKKSAFIIALAVIIATIKPAFSPAQEVYRLSEKEARQFAFEHNYDLINSIKDIEIAKKTVKEYLSAGFPQLNASIVYNDYLARPTFIIPEGAFGPGSPQQKVQFGTKYVGYGEVILNQLLFDGRYILGVQASKKLVDKSRQEFRKKELDIEKEVSLAYATVLVSEENNKILDTTLKEMKKMLYETRETYKAGFLEDTDVDQIELIVADLEASVITSENQTEIAYSYLKFILGLKLQDSVVLTNNISEILKDVNHSVLINEAFNYNNNIEYKILKTQEELAVMRLKAARSEYFPTLSAFMTYQSQAQRNEWDFFNSQGVWFPTSILGIEMNIPILSSGYRSSRVQQEKLNLEKVQVMDDQLRTGLSIKARQAKSDFNNAYLVFQNKAQSLETAEKIYKKTTIKFKEGLSSSLDLLQAHNQFLVSESDLMISILDLLDRKLELEKLLNKN